jgi:hypothetical protein
MKAICSSIVAPYMVAKHNGEHYPMTSGGKGTRAIKIGRLNTCTVRTKLNNWGRKRCHNHNGHQQFPNGCAKKVTDGTQEVSQKVVSDEKPSSRADTHFTFTAVLLVFASRNRFHLMNSDLS